MTAVRREDPSPPTDPSERAPEFVREPNGARASGASATDGSLEERVRTVLHSIYDPEIPVDIYELGLVYGLDVSPEGRVKVTMTLTSPTCPAAQSLPAEVEQKVRAVEGVQDFAFELTWEPPWTPERMSEAAKLTLGMM